MIIIRDFNLFLYTYMIKLKRKMKSNQHKENQTKQEKSEMNTKKEYYKIFIELYLCFQLTLEQQL
jgi:hypothetical protein